MDEWTRKMATIEKLLPMIESANALQRGKGIVAGASIIDAKLFVEAHIETIKANFGIRTFVPYLDRLFDYVVYCKAELDLLIDNEFENKNFR